MPTSIFDAFTRKYQLSKTLRFELKPVGKTFENMRVQLGYDEGLRTFLSDQRIEDAYQRLKPLVDKLHERFIGMALSSESAKSISFHEYVEKRDGLIKLKNKAKKSPNSEEEKEIQRLEQESDDLLVALRNAFGKVFEDAGNAWKEQYGTYAWKVGSNAANGFKVLSSSDILKLIEEENLSRENEERKRIQESLDAFKGFFTYLQGFNQNRANYYQTDKEVATSVATRIIHENLPRFTDNVLVFDTRRDEYLRAHAFLKGLGRVIERKGVTVGAIRKEIFRRGYFRDCLTQAEIEKYNAAIGECNFVINLYNQAKSKESGFRRLSIFNKLYKQIGCGKRDALFYKLDFEKKAEAEVESAKKGIEYHSVDGVLEVAAKAGDVYFKLNKNKEMDNLCELIMYLKGRADYTGFYWSKTALNTISNKYFANWHDLKDRLVAEKVFRRVDKDDEEDVKIPEVIELQPFFEVMNRTENWREILFKPSLLDERNEENRLDIIKSAKSPHEALLSMICTDLNRHAEAFLTESGDVGRITREYFAMPENSKEKEEKRRKWKEAIKAWMDQALAVNRILKYFKVRESRVKGTLIDPILSQTLDVLLYGKEEEVNWFKWYDALRNFLTQEPQDKVKENKLKLNFEIGSLLGGWSDGQEKNKAAVLLRKDGFYYLGVLKKKNIFDTEKEENPIYKNVTPGSGRLILMNLKFQTLAGKGFLGKFGMSYSDMGKHDARKAIQCLQEIMKERYVERYPLLCDIASANYVEKKKFDKDIQEALKEIYLCEFRDIDWRQVERYTESGDMHLFQIYSKDFSPGSSGRRDPQTLYWEALFEDGSPHQLNGGGEIFYRKQAVKEKRVKKGYENKPWVIESRRFTDDKGKLSFHCPIKLNYREPDQSKPKYAFSFVNMYINTTFPSHSDVYFLGIDRGEKHLAYYALVNMSGEIVDQSTLNLPFADKEGHSRTIKAVKRMIDKDGTEHEEKVECKDYNDLLAARAGNRNYARKNWQTIGTIKELKEGYLSQVVHTVARLAVLEAKVPTFITLENLDVGFIRGRQKIEKSVYRQFEVALAKKLGFLVDKEKDGKNGEAGSVMKAIQLTPPVKNFDELKKSYGQAGVMLFVRADYTSQTDPVTGWRKKIYIGSGSEETIRERIIAVFDDIRFDGRDYAFTYIDEATERKWTMYSGKDGKSLDRYYRVKGDKGEWNETEHDIVSMLDGLFVGFKKSTSLKKQIASGVQLRKINEHTAWESLRFALNLIQQIRNSDGSENKRDSDFILSPVRNEHGNHFDSRSFWDEEKWVNGRRTGFSATLPSCGDANGAYNIARKGIIMNEHIKNGWKLSVRDEEWDAWLAGRDFWQQWTQRHHEFLKRYASQRSQ